MPNTSHPDSSCLNRQVLFLAIPALGALTAEPSFVLADSVMVGHLSAVSLADLSLTPTILTTMVGLFAFLTYVTMVTTARLLGVGQCTEGLRVGVDGVWLALLSGLGAGAFLGLAAPWLTVAMGTDGAVAQTAVACLRVPYSGLLGMFVVLAATDVLYGLLDTRMPFVVATAGVAFNVVVNTTLLHGAKMGIAGPGVGIAITQTTTALVLAGSITRAVRAASVGPLPHRQSLRVSLGSGTSPLIRSLGLRVAVLVTVWAATALGEVSLTAHQVINALWTSVAFALDALAVAIQAFTGIASGQARRIDTGSATPEAGALAEEEAGATMATAGWSIGEFLEQTLIWGAETGVLIGVLMTAGATWLPHVFTSDPGVIAAATLTLLVMMSAQPLVGAILLLDSMLISAGDGHHLVRADLVMLVLYAPFALLIGGGVPPGVDGATSGLVLLWIAFAWVFMAARGTTIYLHSCSTA